MHKIRQKVRKNFFFQIIGGAMAPFGQEVATPMRNSESSLLFCVYYSSTLQGR